MLHEKEKSDEKYWDLLSCIVSDNNKVERVKVYVCVFVWGKYRSERDVEIITQQLYESRDCLSNICHFFNNMVSAQFEKYLPFTYFSSDQQKSVNNIKFTLSLALIRYHGARNLSAQSPTLQPYNQRPLILVKRGVTIL